MDGERDRDVRSRRRVYRINPLGFVGEVGSGNG